MRTAIDTNVISAIWAGEPSVPSLLAKLDGARSEGALVISPFVFAELQAYPNVTEEFVRGFFPAAGVRIDLQIMERVWIETGPRYAHYAARRRKETGEGPRRLLTDFLIGAHALVQADRLLTLDLRMYQRNFPELRLY